MALQFLADRKDMCIYPWYISDITATKDISKIASINVKKAFVMFEKDFMAYYYDIESANEIGKTLLNKIITDHEFFKKAIENIYKFSDELIDYCQTETKKDLQKLSNKDLLKIYEVYIEQLRTLRTWGWIPVFVDGLTDTFLTEHLQNEFKKFLYNIGKSEKFSEHYSVLSSAEKMSEVQKEELARLELLLKISQNPKWEEIKTIIVSGDITVLEKNHSDIYKLLVNHTKEFGWLTYAYIGPPMTMGHLYKLLKDSLESGDIKEQRDKIIKHYEELSKNKKEIIQEIKLPDNLEYLFMVSAELMFMKDYRKGIYQKSYLLMDSVILEIAKRVDISIKAVKYLVIDELRQFLENKSENFRDTADKRMKNCCYIAEEGNITIYEGEKCYELKKSLIKESKELKNDVLELKGQTAYKGVVRGEVKIVLTVDDIAKVKEGDVLVSSATNPDLILAMKKAGAFVTDIGGITSHAAIVSRELKKPCVVGTHEATHILKDGDLVEVDADHGIVRILK